MCIRDSYPDAKSFHHAIKGGLLFHTYTMLENAKKLSATYTFLNTDLLFSGVILHDICKTEEMECNELGVVETYTKDGHCLLYTSFLHLCKSNSEEYGISNTNFNNIDILCRQW